MLEEEIVYPCSCHFVQYWRGLNVLSNWNTMNRTVACFCFAIATIVFPHFSFAQEAQSNSKDWARWRGPTGNAIASADQKPPTSWSATESVIWKSKVPGTGHASPIIFADKIFLATAELKSQSQSVVCFDRQSGSQLWQTEVNNGEFPKKIYPKNTHASSTVATDGNHVFAVFNHHGAVDLTKLGFDGEIVWKKKVGNYDPFYKFGFGASPIIHNGKIIVTTESKVDSGIYAFDLKTGSQIWKIDRDGVSSYSTPVVAKVSGKEQLLISGGSKVKSYDPKTGAQNWETPTDWKVSCGTMVWDENMVFISGGYPAQQTLAMNASDGKLVWENNVKSYEQSLLAVNGYIYAHSDNGVLYCWRAADGQEMWKNRFGSRRNPVSVSPVLANGNIYFTAENGETVVVKLDPKEFKEVARNKLGDKAFATPAFCDNQIYTRVGDSSTGSDHQWLYCLGKK